MRTSLPVTRISDGRHPAIHSYYDICPESPDRSRLLYSSFIDDAVPGACRVVLTDHAGSEHRVVGGPGDGIGHTARYPMWLDDERIGYHRAAESAAAGWSVLRLGDGSERQRPGGLRQFHTDTGRGLVLLQGADANPHGLRRAVAVVDREGETIGSFTVADAIAAHPAPDRLPPDDRLNFMNAKWTPAGDRFFVVFTDEVYRRQNGLPMPDRFKCLVVAAADGTGVRFLGDFSHHPHWTPDGREAIALCWPEGRQDLIAFDAETGATRTLLRDVDGVHGTITPDGRWFIIDEFRSPEEGFGTIVRWDLASGTREELVGFRHERWEHRDGHHPHPVLSRDGRALYFNAMDDGSCQVYRLELPA